MSRTVVAWLHLGILAPGRCAQEKASLETLWKDYRAHGLAAPPGNDPAALARLEKEKK